MLAGDDEIDWSAKLDFQPVFLAVLLCFIFISN